MTDTVDATTWTDSDINASSASPSHGTSGNPTISAEMYNSLEYKMNYKFLGKAVIIDNNRFLPSTGHQDRIGSEKDVSAIEEGLKSIGQFDITRIENLPKDSLEKKLTQIACGDFSDYGCFVCVISSHGDEGRIWATDDSIDLVKILETFHASKAKSLFGKPKIFLIQACRGNEIDQGAEIDVIIDTPSAGASMTCSHSTGSGSTGNQQTQRQNSNPLAVPGQTVTLPNEADFLVMFASSEVRNTNAGSWYVQSLAEAFKTMEKGEDFLSVITRANAAVAYDRTYDGQPLQMKGMKQMPCFRSMLTKTLIMKP